MTRPTDPQALMDRRRATEAARTELAASRWTAFQAANRKRYAGRTASRPPGRLARLLARAKTPGRVLLLQTSGVWEMELDASLGSTPGPTATLGAYVRAGPDPAAQPRALFDQSWYLESAPGLAGSLWPPLAHYLVVGDGHNLSPHPLVDGPAYRARHGARMSTGRMTALEHFLFEGAAQGANPHPLFDVRFYVGQSDELATTGENPLSHYLHTGWREGLEPHPLFAGAWYLERNPHAQAAGVAPLLHYVTSGAAEGLDPHPLFDTAHYRRQRQAGLRGEPLEDYLARGARTQKSPTPHFKPAYYLGQVGDLPLAQADPLQHYLTTGTYQGLWPAPDFDETSYFVAHPDAGERARSGLEDWTRRRTERPRPGAAAGRTVPAEALFSDLRQAVDPDPAAYDVAAYAALRRPRQGAGPREPVRVIALRLTSAWDWVAVVRALPNYRGQLQPRLPADGSSDPGEPGTLARDISLAQRYGLSGFCHEVASAAAVAQVAAADFPFCFAPAPSLEASLIVAALAASNALRVEGRPMLVLPPGADTAGWRKAGDLFLIQRGGPPAAGFDAHLADGPVRVPEGPPGPVINPEFRGLVHDAMALIGERLALPLAPDCIPLVTAAHDTTPRAQDVPVVWQGASPGALQAWLEAASDSVRGLPADHRLVFVHAWNDWETGAALAPDLRFGHGWLEAVRNAADGDLLA